MTTRLYEVFDIDLFNQMVEQRYVNVRSHRDHPLSIVNYADVCQFDNVWNEVTLQSRGLIYNHETLEVIARPFPKFFNWDQGQQRFPPDGPVLRMSKMDGSLGILYPVIENIPGGVNVHFRIATRGSFHSDQAEWATKFYWDNSDGFYPQPDKTYLFEIIYPENRIVVDYGDYEGLVLLDVIDNATGLSDTDEFDDCEWDDKVERIPMSFAVQHIVDIPKGDEGFVYLWPTRNFRTKMKSAEYIEMHKLVTGLNKKVVWAGMVAGKSAAEICEGYPDEFHEFIKDTYNELDGKVNDVVDHAYLVFNKIMVELGPDPSRKDFALKAAKSPRSKYLFAALDNRSLYEIALQDVKPKIEQILPRE